MPDTGTIPRDAIAPSAVTEVGPPVTASKRRRLGGRRLLRWALLGLGPVALLVGGVAWYLTGGRWVSTDNAYVRADMVNVATDVPGIVAAVAVRDNQRVAPGDVLFRLDEEPFRLALARAEAELNQVADDVAAQRAAYRQKQEEIRLADSTIAFAEREFQRQAELVKRSVVSQAQYDRAQHDLDAARQQRAALAQALAGLAASLGGGPDTSVEQNPHWLAARAARDRAARDLRQAVVRAPIAGITANVAQLQPGEYLQAGQAAFSLVSADHLWVDANPKETELTWVKAGDPATITVDSYPGRVWRGHVASLSPASGAEFALLPAQNTTGNWVKVVQRIPVRVEIEPQPDAPPLRAGMSVTGDIDTGRSRSLAGLLGGTVAGAAQGAERR
ncbi:MAG: HlyD family secretion protein [Dongiaceae bacterium]